MGRRPRGGNTIPAAAPAAPTRPSQASGSCRAATSDRKVGLAYDIGGRGDQSFNDAAAAGLIEARADLGVEAERGSRPATAEPDVREGGAPARLLARPRYNPVIADRLRLPGVGRRRSPKEPPDIKPSRSSSDSAADGANVANLLLRRGAGLVPGRRGRRR